MAQLVVRDLEEKVKLALRRRAKAHGRSMEEETRVIIREAVGKSRKGGKSRKSARKKDEGFGTRFARHFAALDAPFEAPEWDEPVMPARFNR